MPTSQQSNSQQSDSPSADYQQIDDPKIATFLLNPANLKHLAPFFEREGVSVSEAARDLNDKPNSVLARVRRFLALGLLEHYRSQARAGRAIKYYRTPAPIFYIPFEHTNSATLVEALQARDHYYQQILTEAVVHARTEHLNHHPYGTRIYKDAQGHLQLQSARSPLENYTLLANDAPSALSLWRDEIYLDNDDAKALQQEMFALFKKYNHKGGKKRYLLRLGLAPLE